MCCRLIARVTMLLLTVLHYYNLPAQHCTALTSGCVSSLSFSLLSVLLTCRTVLRSQIDEFEMALLANLTPETADEALSIIPSLQVCNKQTPRAPALASSSGSLCMRPHMPQRWLLVTAAACRRITVRQQ
jgi:hypothetical protein